MKASSATESAKAIIIIALSGNISVIEIASGIVAQPLT